MATDQPTLPDLGNLTTLQLLALPDWSVNATNVVGKDDTFVSMDDCVIALFYRLLRSQIEYINDAFACRVDTPLSIAAHAALAATLHWTPTDWPATSGLAPSFIGVTPAPDIVFSCNGIAVDDVSGTLFLNPPTPGTSLVYSVIMARGSLGTSPPAPAYPFLFGIRNHADRWVFADDTTKVREDDIAYMATYSLPEWPQDTVNPIILAKVADLTDPVDTGPLNRIGFEFGLGPAPAADPNSNARDYVLYVRWYDSGDVEQRVIAVLPTSGDPATFPAAEPIGVTPGRRITLGFHRYNTGLSWGIRFYVNGRVATSVIDGFAAPDIATASDVRLHVGSAQLGLGYTGGPVNSVYIWVAPDPVDIAAAMLTAYVRNEGFEAP